MTGLLVFFIFSFMLTFCIFRAGLSTYMTKNELKKYKREVSFFDRYFLLSAPSYAQNKYAKSKKRVIFYSNLLRLVRAFNFILHGSLLVVIIGFCLEKLGLIPIIDFTVYVASAFIIECVIMIIILGFIGYANDTTGYATRRDHHLKHRWRR